MSARELTLCYVADAMCSWCWGFAPVAKELARDYGERLDFRYVMGGLRPGPHADRVDGGMKDYLRSHWQAVHDRTGQPFNDAFFQREDFLYDTEPAAKAVVTVRHLDSPKEASFFHVLQHAYYARNIDITDPGQYPPLLNEADVAVDRFQALYGTGGMEDAVHADYLLARQLGVTGFPSLVLRWGGLAYRVTNGFVELESARAAVDTAIEDLAGRHHVET